MGAIVVTFPTVHAALAAEGRFKAAGLGAELIPVPRGISSDCGFCLRAAFAGEEARCAILTLAGNFPREGLWSEESAVAAAGRRRERRYERIQ
jgi:hypothetical protein